MMTPMEFLESKGIYANHTEKAYRWGELLREYALYCKAYETGRGDFSKEDMAKAYNGGVIEGASVGIRVVGGEDTKVKHFNEWFYLNY